MECVEMNGELVPIPSDVLEKDTSADRAGVSAWVLAEAARRGIAPQTTPTPTTTPAAGKE